MEHKKVIIFDFDGTIADSFGIFVEALSAAVERRNPLIVDDIESLRRSSSTRDIIKKLGIRPWQMPSLVFRGRREIAARMDRVTVFKGISEALKDIAAEYTIYILSTNSEENIMKFLKKHKLGGYIHGVYGNNSILGKAKSLKKLLKKENLASSACLYVGDETRDIEAAHISGMPCIAVTWGYSVPGALRLHAPEALVATPCDLPKVIKGFL
jgi:phosphoglycolate phosphatase